MPKLGSSGLQTGERVTFDFAEIAAVIALLAEWFPKTFFVYERRRKPLKLRIDMDLQTVLDGAITPSELHRALRVYCRVARRALSLPTKKTTPSRSWLR